MAEFEASVIYKIISKPSKQDLLWGKKSLIPLKTTSISSVPLMPSPWLLPICGAGFRSGFFCSPGYPELALQTRLASNTELYLRLLPECWD